LKTYITR